jgi:hypothetical protein
VVFGVAGVVPLDHAARESERIDRAAGAEVDYADFIVDAIVDDDRGLCP